MFKSKLIQWLGGYTKAELIKVANRRFDNYDDMRRLGGFYDDGEVAVLEDGIAGTFLVRKFDGADNNGTIIKADK